jgi:hypothetical protein
MVILRLVLGQIRLISLFVNPTIQNKKACNPKITGFFVEFNIQLSSFRVEDLQLLTVINSYLAS